MWPLIPQQWSLQPFWIGVGFVKPHMPMVYRQEFDRVVPEAEQVGDNLILQPTQIHSRLHVAMPVRGEALNAQLPTLTALSLG